MQHKSHLPWLRDNLPCPAVSHSCTFTFLSCISIVFILKSTPIVEIKLSENDPSVYRISKLVFPTPLSPTSSILKRKSLQLITAARFLETHEGFTSLAFALTIPFQHRPWLWRKLAIF